MSAPRDRLVASARRFVEALARGDDDIDGMLHPEVTLRRWGHDEGVSMSATALVADRLHRETRPEVLLELEVAQTLIDGDRAAVGFRIHGITGGRYEEHNRMAVLGFEGDRVRSLELYAPIVLPFNRRTGWKAPASIAGAELDGLIHAAVNSIQDYPLPPVGIAHGATRWYGFMRTGDVDPRSNTIYGASFSPDEANRRIAEVLAHHRDRGRGFTWRIAPHDTPNDLPGRLVAHGFELAGIETVMFRRLPPDPPIDVNPDVAIETVAHDDAERIDVFLDVVARCFTMRPETKRHLRQSWFGRADVDSAFFIAHLEGRPAGFGAWAPRGGMVLLGGAATLPEFRGRGVYSTLLRRRLDDAVTKGYHLAIIQAAPAARDILLSRGFEVRYEVQIYAWMPVMDPNVIRHLVG